MMANHRHLGSIRKLGFALPLLALTLLAPRIATAQTVSGTTGDLDALATAPANVTELGTASYTKAFGFQEQQNYTLTQSLATNISQSGTYTTLASLTPGTIAAGTKVDSYMVYSNPPTNTVTNYKGSVTFDQNIIGVEVLTGTLNGTDFLGATGTQYPNGTNGTISTDRGLEFGQDGVMVSFIGDTLSYNLTTSAFVDEIRIITAGSSIATPEPSSLAAFGLGALALGGILLAARRKKAGLTLA